VPVEEDQAERCVLSSVNVDKELITNVVLDESNLGRYYEFSKKTFVV
jgi:hypothetical protein